MFGVSSVCTTRMMLWPWDGNRVLYWSELAGGHSMRLVVWRLFSTLSDNIVLHAHTCIGLLLCCTAIRITINLGMEDVPTRDTRGSPSFPSVLRCPPSLCSATASSLLCTDTSKRRTSFGRNSHDMRGMTPPPKMSMDEYWCSLHVECVDASSVHEKH